MKIRLGFVSNSSSASFIIATKKDLTESFLRKILEAIKDINVNGIAYPCSFLEEECGFEGINILSSEDFLKEVWLGQNFNEFRKKLLKINRDCPHFKI